MPKISISKLCCRNYKLIDSSHNLGKNDKDTTFLPCLFLGIAVTHSNELVVADPTSCAVHIMNHNGEIQTTIHHMSEEQAELMKERKPAGIQRSRKEVLRARYTRAYFSYPNYVTVGPEDQIIVSDNTDNKVRYKII